MSEHDVTHDGGVHRYACQRERGQGESETPQRCGRREDYRATDNRATVASLCWVCWHELGAEARDHDRKQLNGLTGHRHWHSEPECTAYRATALGMGSVDVDVARGAGSEFP